MKLRIAIWFAATAMSIVGLLFVFRAAKDDRADWKPAAPRKRRGRSGNGYTTSH